MAEDKNFHNSLGRRPLAKSSTNFLRRLAVEERPAMSLNSSHVHPSRCGADFFGIHVNASVIALSGTGKKGDLHVDGGAGTCVCRVTLVSLERKLAATTGSDY
jgi:hypothetical protein